MTKIMTPAERAVCALTLGQPDEIPTFELEFQLSEELCGKMHDFARIYRRLR